MARDNMEFSQRQLEFLAYTFAKQINVYGHRQVMEQVGFFAAMLQAEYADTGVIDATEFVQLVLDVRAGKKQVDWE